MFVEFTQELYKKLIENEFAWVYNDRQTNQLSEDTKYIQLIKYIGALLYIVNIINADKINLDIYKQNLENYRNNIDFNKADVKYIILINIFVSANPSENLIQIVSENNFKPDDFVHTIHYMVNINESTFISPVDNILNISNYIENALDTSKNSNENNPHCLETIAKETRKESVLKTKSNNTYFTYGLIIINILIFIIMYFQSKNLDIIQLLIKFGANSKQLVLEQKQYWRLFTSMFIHIDFLHLIYNCFALYLFGIRVEKYFGKSRFILIYIFSGIIGNIISIIFTVFISAGASGAVYGLTGAIVAMTQQKNKNVDGMSFYLITIIAVIGIAFGFLDSTVNNYAHIGGLFAGYTLGFLLCP